MTFNQLAKQIAKLTPAQRKRPAVIAMQQTGEVAEIDEICKIGDFRGKDGENLPDQMVIWYDNRSEPKIF